MSRTNYQPSFGGRLLGPIGAIFLAALLLYIAVRLVEAVLVPLLIGGLVVGVVSGLVLWWRSRSRDW